MEIRRRYTQAGGARERVERSRQFNHRFIALRDICGVGCRQKYRIRAAACDFVHVV